jgi:uncharacterized protein (TIGR02147 family)
LAFFKTQDYRESIRVAFKAPGRGGTKPTFAAAARACLVQPTYFSNVLKGRADFSEDQIHSLCEFLALDETEAAYLKACHQWARSGLPERRRQLLARVTEQRQQALSPGARFQAAAVDPVRRDEEVSYYLDPMHHVLGMCLELVPEMARLPELRAALGLSESRAQSLLERLTASGRLQIEKGRFKRAPINFHLGAESPLLFAHQAALRQLSVERMRQLKRADFKAFSATFSAPQSLRPRIEEILTRALEEVRAVTQSAKASDDTVFQVNLDLFPWFIRP